MMRKLYAFVSLAAVAVSFGIAAHVHADTSTFDEERVVRQISRAWGGNDKKAIRVADCESSLNPKAASPGEKYLGLWQFSEATWKAYGGPGDDPRDVGAYKQTVVAWALFQDRGWAPWPSCA